MGHVIFGMNASVDGYVSGASGTPNDVPMPGAELHQHFNDLMSTAVLCLYGRKLYTDMRYWDSEDAGTREVEDASGIEAEFAAAWRATPKVVVSTTLADVGPNARLVSSNVDAELRRVVEETDGEIDVGGPTLAATLTRLGLIDEYRVYARPVTIGGGLPLFASGTQLELSLLGVETFADGTVLMRYAPVRS